MRTTTSCRRRNCQPTRRNTWISSGNLSQRVSERRNPLLDYLFLLHLYRLSYHFVICRYIQRCVSISILTLSEPEPKRLNNGFRKYPDFLTIQGKTSLDNPEYIMSQDEGPLTPQTLGIPTPDLEKVLTNGAFGSQVRQRSSEEESDHEYYNDFDRLERELQPLKPLRKNETTV